MTPIAKIHIGESGSWRAIDNVSALLRVPSNPTRDFLLSLRRISRTISRPTVCMTQRIFPC
jgi:hypothetical protein